MKVGISSEIHPARVDPSCKGWLVDSFSGKYWIRCLDPKHIISKEDCSRLQAQATNPTRNPATDCQPGKGRLT